MASFVSTFSKRLHDAVMNQASRNWSPQVRQKALEYMHSLVKGDGTAPPDMTDGTIKFIRQRFAMTCYLMKVDEAKLPGQRTDWYRSYYESAVQYQRNKQRPSQ